MRRSGRRPTKWREALDRGGIGGLLTALLPPPANFIGFMVLSSAHP